MTEKIDQRRKRKKRRRKIQLCIKICLLLMLTVWGVPIGWRLLRTGNPIGYRYVEHTGKDIDAIQPDLDVELLTVNEYSRPGVKVNKINGIVIHYTANPGATAMQNRNYFEGLKDTCQTKASSHFIVGLNGEIVQCIPTWEEAYASNSRNMDTISIETCHPSEDGRYTQETYDSTVQLTAWLCRKFGLSEQDVIRHYDVTGKNCPKYFVEHEDAWHIFKEDVKKVLDKM